MFVRISASKTRFPAIGVVAFCAASCASNFHAIATPSHGPPARLIVVTDDRLSLRANAWLDLHARLAEDESETPSELAPAKAAYAHLAREALDSTTRSVAACKDDRCALGLLDPTAAEAFPWFIANEWDERAKISWRAIERAHAEWSPEGEAVLVRLSHDLATQAGAIDVVSTRTAPLPLLAGRGPCFTKDGILDCLVVRSLLAGESPLRASFGDRLWTVLVVHAVAAVFTRLEPRHASVDRQAVSASEPAMLDFVTSEWHGGVVTPDLATRFHQRAKAFVPPDTASH